MSILMRYLSSVNTLVEIVEVILMTNEFQIEKSLWVRIAYVLAMVLGWSLAIMIVLGVLGFGVVREGMIWGCW